MNNGVWLKEFPSNEFNVLDGSLVAIVGTHEVYAGLAKDNPHKKRIFALFQDALRGFKANYRCFSSPVGGVYFSDKFEIPRLSYYDIIINQLDYLSKIDGAVRAIAEHYSFEERSLFEKLTIYYWHRLKVDLLPRFGGLSPCVQ